VTPSDKNNFPSVARKRLIDLGWSVTVLAGKIKRPRETVSRAIHSNRFPHVRKQVAQKLKIELLAA
jgi:ribosome-binding protein aMBF1 (putative translation factor)